METNVSHLVPREIRKIIDPKVPAGRYVIWGFVPWRVYVHINICTYVVFSGASTIAPFLLSVL